MKLEDQVCNLELSKKLKELGLFQRSIFSWQKGNNNIYSLNISFLGELNCESCSAFIAAELLEILPNTLTLNENDPMSNGRINIVKALLMPDNIQLQSHFIINYACTCTDDGYFGTLFKNIYDTNLANACARLLIYLIENGLVKNDNN